MLAAAAAVYTVYLVGWMAAGGGRVRGCEGATMHDGGVIEAGPVGRFANRSVTPFPDNEFYLVRLEDGGFLALHRKCTHLGCSVPWRPDEERFACPCHASAFDIRGAVLSSPAPRPLDLFAVAIKDGRVLVDTSRTLRRTDFEPEQVTRVGA